MIFWKLYDSIKVTKKIKEGEEKAMIGKKDMKEELNIINIKNIIQNAETRMAVHTHTHLSFSKYKKGYRKFI